MERPAAPAPRARARVSVHVPRGAPIKVADLDLLGGAARVTGCAGYRAVRVLVRRGGRPVRWLTLAHDGGPELPADRIAAALAELTGPPETGAERTGATEGTLQPISIVVATRDRAGLVRGCVEAILGCGHARIELIVVDNAPASGATARALSGLPITYVRESRPGVARARNRGIEAASHEIIAFTDDDARPDPSWLHALVARFDDPEVAAVTGLVAPAELETPAQRLFELACGGMGKGLRPRTFRREEMDTRERIRVQHIGTGANMAFRRPVLEAVGGFDVHLGAGTPARGGEDLEMFHRVIRAGYTMCYDPSAIVWHVHRREMPALRRQLGDTGCAFGVYLATIARSDPALRRSVWIHGLLPWSAWLLGRFASRAIGRHPRPFALLWAELAGAVGAARALARDRQGRGDPVP